MNYSKATKRLGIPVVWYGDKIIPEVEMQRFQVIENMLLAGTKGIRNCVFNDGQFALNPETDDTFVVTLQATGHEPSATGMIGGAFFDAPPVLTWTGLKKGYVYFLYLYGSSKTYEDCSVVTTVSSLHLMDSDGLLLATADCRSENPSIDPYPDGKLYSEDLAQHINDVENPHGRMLIQDEIYVRQKLCLHDPEGNAAEVEVLKDGKPVSIPAGAFVGVALELAGRRVETIDFESTGSAGKILSVAEGLKVVFVQVSRKVPLTGTLGETAIGYFGQDSQLHLANEFSFCNSGDVGLPLRALVYCG